MTAIPASSFCASDARTTKAQSDPTWTARARVPGPHLRREGQRPLRICHLGKYYPPASGGIETHVQSLARAQASLGAEVQVICVNHADGAGRDLTARPFGRTETIEDRDGPVAITRLGRRASFCRFDLCRDLDELRQRLQHSRIDILHLHAPNATMLLAMAWLRPAVPLVITHHSDVVRQRILKYALRPVEYFVYSRAARILATSAAYGTGSNVLQRYADRSEVLPLGLDLAPYLQPSKAALDHARTFRTTHGLPIWLAVGRLVYYKGLPIALQALASVPGTLIVIGTGPLEAELRRQAAELGVADRVIWHGHASPDELAGAYHAATALWFPSTARSEGFGLVQVEAMASGCPVINTAIPGSGVAWVSRHQETGLTVPINDSRALAGAAERLVSEPGLRERLGNGGRRRALQEFQDTVMAGRSLEIYQRVLGQASPRPGPVALSQ